MISVLFATASLAFLLLAFKEEDRLLKGMLLLAAISNFAASVVNA